MEARHLTDAELMELAARRVRHQHLEHCAFCAEQYETVLEMRDIARREEEPQRTGAGTPFRLAAQTDEGLVAELSLRQTWYLEDGESLLRVFEHVTREELHGFLLCDPGRLGRICVRFSGIDADFTPASDGSFLIGASGIAIEPMSVTLIEE
jgi:hypothetical protein